MNNDYEQYRMKILVELQKTGTESVVINRILNALDNVSNEYSISHTGKELSVFSQKWQRYMEAYACSRAVEGYSKNALKSKCYIIRSFFNSVQKDIENISSMDVRNWLYHKNVCDGTKDGYRCAINSFYKWCISEELIKSNPIDKIPQIKFDRKLKDYLNRMEVEIVRNSIIDKRGSAVFEFLLSTGCRVSEMCNAKKQDVNLDGSIKVFGKGRKERLVWLTPKAKLSLEEYLETRNDNSPYLFVAERGYARPMTKETVELLLRNVCRKVDGVISKNVTPHVLRRTFATLALERGMPIHSISRMLGHANIAVTERYAQTNDQMMHKDHEKYVV